MKYLLSSFKFQASSSKLQDGGFTLIETLVAISIFAVMMLSITLFFATLYKEQGRDIARIQNVEIAGRAVDGINGEIRKMRRAENGYSPLSAAEAQRLVFYSDVDNDSLTEKIEYILNGTNLERRLTEPGGALDYSGAPIVSVVASNVVNGVNPIFRYYDESYTGTEPPLANPVNVTRVRIIEISLDINTDTVRLSTPVHIETKVQPRNLKSYD